MNYINNQYYKLLQQITVQERDSCLEFFNNKDAYTGEDLLEGFVFDFVIPIECGGLAMKNNIVPSNKPMHKSYDLSFKQWYRRQNYYNKNRLDKILIWMAKFKQYTLVPMVQMKYIEFSEKANVQNFKIDLPNGCRQILYYTNTRDIPNKYAQLQECLLTDWEEYSKERWVWLNQFDNFRRNYEDKTKNFLSRCSDYILLGNIFNTGVLSDNATNKIYSNEIPLSSTSSELNDCVFSSGTDREYTSQARNQNLMLANEILLGNTKENSNTKIHKSQKPKIMKQYKDSQYYKLKQLYKTDDIKIFKLHKLKNKDINYTYWKDSTEKFPEVIEPHNKKLLDKKTKESMCAKDYKKLANKPFRNLHGENLYEYRPHTIKGNKKGIIDRSKPYKWEWSYVWADNVFEFDGSKYRIDDSVEQYQGKLTKMNRKKVPDMEVRYEMDKILVFEQDGKRYYFDQKIDRIDNDLIHAI